MLPIIKKPTQDGTYTVYFGGVAVGHCLTSAAADQLMEELRRSAVQE
jgi:hypothetical protein